MTNTKATTQIERLLQVEGHTNTKVIQKMALETQRLLQVNCRTNTKVSSEKHPSKNTGFLKFLPT